MWIRTVIVIATIWAANAMARAEVPTPKVTLIPSSAPGAADRNYPFFATDIVLKNFGYIEEEFFFEGTASGYSYKSRLLVGRPANQSRFNGVVIVE